MYTRKILAYFWRLLVISHQRQPVVREIALKALYNVEIRKAVPQESLHTLFHRYSFSDRDKALATEIVYGSIRWRRRLDWILGRLMRGNPESLTPWIRQIIRMGLYQLIMMNQIPDSAATDESVKLARRYGHEGTVRLTNAIMRNAIRKRKEFEKPECRDNPIEEMGITYSYPTWLIKRWIERYGTEGAENLMKAGNKVPPLTIRVNTDRISPKVLVSRLRDHGIQVEPSRWFSDFVSMRHRGDPRQLPYYDEGLFQIQDESTGLAVHLLNPQPGETIVDLCCAPGGKTTYIAQFVCAEGYVVACDISLRRLNQVEENRRRLGLSQLHIIAMDGSLLALEAGVDRVIVDAPCSGLGTIARKPDIRWRRSVEDFQRFHALQLKLLENGAALVKKGGLLVYSTCTIEPEENEDVVSEFCNRQPEFHLEKPVDWPNEISEVMDFEGKVKTLPSIHGVDGIFAVRLRRDV